MTKTPKELAQERLDLAYQHAKLGLVDSLIMHKILSE